MMIKRVIWAICFICGVALLANTQDSPHFSESNQLRHAYDLIFELKMDSATTLINQIKLDDPFNKLVYHVENYMDFLTLFITEDDSLFQVLEANKLMRLKEIRSGPSDSPYYRFSQAELHLQWALIRAKLDAGSFLPDMTMINEINKAYRLLETNERIFPTFSLNKKSLSLLHSLISYIPQVLQKVFRVKGSLASGQQEIESLVEAIKAEDLFSTEIYAIHAYMLLHLFHAPQSAWEAINHPKLVKSNSPLSLFLRSSIALKLGKNKEALALFSDRPIIPSTMPFYYLDYLEGRAALYQGEHERAAEKLEHFVHHFKGRHFIKDAYQKLAWTALIKDQDIEGYALHMDQVKRYGANELEDDQQAMADAKSKHIPNVHLLQARLYFDGGYYDKALAILQRHSHTLKSQKATKVEYHYRMGRVYQKQETTTLSLSHYRECLASSRRKSFYGCNAALQSGIVYEQLNQSSKAVAMYQRCKSIKSKKYKNQLHLKAQAGLDRLARAPQ